MDVAGCEVRGVVLFEGRECKEERGGGGGQGGSRFGIQVGGRVHRSVNSRGS